MKFESNKTIFILSVKIIVIWFKFHWLFSTETKQYKAIIDSHNGLAPTQDKLSSEPMMAYFSHAPLFVQKLIPANNEEKPTELWEAICNLTKAQ